MTRGLPVGALAALLLLLPFEPRRPTLPVLDLELTLLEALAAATTAVLLYAHRGRLPALVRRPPLPLALLWTYVAAHLASAAVAPLNRGLAAKFVLRMAAAAVFAAAVAAAPRDVLRRSLPALTLAGALVAALAILEGSGVVALDPFLDLFREKPFLIGTARRGSAGSESPNLAAAMMLYGLVPAVGAAALLRGSARVVVPSTALFALGVLFTYSRGGLVALTVALVTLAVALGTGGRAWARAPAQALSTLLVVAAAFFVAGGPLRLPFSPRGGAPAYAARYAPAETFLALGPGAVRAVPVTITNTGSRPWATAVLACSWRRADAAVAMDWAATAGCPVAAVPPAPPGGSVRIDAVIRAPADEGRYLLVWDLAADGWIMSSLDVTPAVVPAVVSRAPAEARPFVHPVPPGTWQRGRGALWRAAIAMWTAHPLTGVGPDNFRWVHPAYAGWPPGGDHDTRILANNLFLEAAATTGTIGLLALVATLAATARAAWRARSRAPAGSEEAVWASVLLALTTGVAVHGMVDSFLGFTGHYLFLGLVVGAASAAGGPPDRSSELDRAS